MVVDVMAVDVMAVAASRLCRRARRDRFIMGAVLFFSGISLRLDWRPLRIAVLVFGGAMWLGGVIFVVLLPVE